MSKKTYNGAISDYYYDGGRLIWQIDKNSSGTVLRTMYFTYDESGNVFSIDYNGTTYYYIWDGLGNVAGLVNSAGLQRVTYTYDTWGNLIDVSGSTVGSYNPFRYKGYYYDTETGLYYLQSRYYDPYVGRFLNADGQLNDDESILGANLFAYCENNPVIFVDLDGHAKTYVFYYNGNRSLKDFAVNSAYFNSKSKNVVMNEVNTAEEFIQKWNNMSNAGTVYLYLHGGEGILCFSNTMGFSGENSFSNLQSKKTGMIYLFSCHGGSGSEGNNVAWMFSKLTGSRVKATTSGVSFSKIGKSYQARIEKSGFWNLSSGWGTYYYQMKWGNKVAKSFKTIRKWAI